MTAGMLSYYVLHYSLLWSRFLILLPVLLDAFVMAVCRGFRDAWTLCLATIAAAVVGFTVFGRESAAGPGSGIERISQYRIAVSLSR